jgi:hypothetical protein
MPVIEDNSGAGYSLVSVLMGMAIFVSIISITANNMLENQKVFRHTGDRFDRAELTSYIRKRADCSRIPADCGGGELISVYRKNGDILISDQAKTRIGSWSIRAVCAADSHFAIQVAKQTPGGGFVKDAPHGKPLDWDHSQGTILTKRELCQPAAPKMVAESEVELKTAKSCLVSDSSDLPCQPPLPGNCDPGYKDAGLSLDRFGGSFYPVEASMNRYGERWIRYCVRDDVAAR